MFDQCDSNTTKVIEAAIEEARRFGHGHLGTEHLLLALTARRDLLPASVRELMPEPDAMRAALSAVLGGETRRDAELLKTVGIDLGEVRSAVRRTFGDEAIDALRGRRVHQPWQPWRRPSRRCTSLLAGTMAVAPRVKQALERARRAADGRRRAAIDPAGLLLGMVEVEDALSNRLLRDTGVDPTAIGHLLAAAER